MSRFSSFVSKFELVCLTCLAVKVEKLHHQIANKIMHLFWAKAHELFEIENGMEKKPLPTTTTTAAENE